MSIFQEKHSLSKVNSEKLLFQMGHNCFNSIRTVKKQNKVKDVELNHRHDLLIIIK